MKRLLRDGRTIQRHPQLDRYFEGDERTKNFGIEKGMAEAGMDLSKRDIISKRWITTKPCHKLDQEPYGACVGMGIANAMRHEPILGDVDKFSEQWAIWECYFNAQKTDEFPGGEYPHASPKAGGTSILAALKWMKKQGLISNYYWATTLDELLVGLCYYGPAVIGINWYAGMVNPGPDRICRPTGQLLGGHCTLVTEVNHRRKTISGPNSWGNTWNANGMYTITWTDMEKLLKRQGECVFIRV